MKTMKTAEATKAVQAACKPWKPYCHKSQTVKAVIIIEISKTETQKSCLLVFPLFPCAIYYLNRSQRLREHFFLKIVVEI